MTINKDARRGSALLIVLGMLAFMIVSAVGFSAYMRYSRMPSSYLRRTSSSRLLVKAALAEAIDAVDRAVANNPRPNIGTKWISSDRQSSGSGVNRTANIWMHRVLMGTNNWNMAGIGFNDTVSTLTMEALAYIPPPLVNAARYYGRLTPTAVWKPFGFDSGRYAFMALDVSDYFDVNRMSSGRPRSSAANGRISLAYMFENPTHKSSTGSDAWDEFMKNFRTLDEKTYTFDFTGGRYPLISLADFNLALGAQGSVGGYTSPFYDYVNGQSSVGFLGVTSTDDKDRIARMTFVTDGLFPQSKATSENEDILDLSNPENQPFAFSDLDDKGASAAPLSKTLMGGFLNDNEWRSRLGRLGCLQLFDYLDTDHVPASIALPTAERHPMICGIEPKLQGSFFKVNKTIGNLTGPNGAALPEEGNERQVEVVVGYKIDPQSLIPGFVGGEISALAVFPFNHDDPTDESPYTVDGRFSLFLSDCDMPLRTGNPSDMLHLGQKNIADSSYAPATGMINIKLPNIAMNVPKQVVQPENALVQVQGLRLVDGQRVAPYFGQDGNEILRVTYQWTQTKESSYGPTSTAGWTPTAETIVANHDPANMVKVESSMKVISASGVASDDFLNKIKAGEEVDVWLNAAVWLRVIDGNQDTVDMVPACILDDKTQNSVNDAQQIYTGLSGRLGEAYPLFKFSTGVSFKLGIAGLESLAAQAQEIVLSPRTALVPDPRFNYAPEHWFGVNQALDKNLWLDNNLATGQNRDGDIFMSTSDSGYLQSKYELAFLPRIGNLENYGSDETVCKLAAPGGRNMTAIPASVNDAVNAGFAWSTYDPFGDDEQAFENLPWTSEGTGFKVDPYTDSTNIMMSVFANTPIDWKRASTNKISGVEEFRKMTADNFNKKYAFNEYSSGPRITWDDLTDIAGRFMKAIEDQDADAKNWEEAWQNLGWYYNKDEFCGEELDDATDDIASTDRKFLYGYWRDCFAVKQQLFLVFVRAEPAVMGGEAGGRTPPQLGGKAVALVWRDPSEAADPAAPHQTRVLFYRQFE